ncbi:hypothetical protein MANES_09G077815v8 [Manihot esculenta]|uniref:Uncharacterized protein n=1 Tax=Manihot esculenta TaxID=3983 RepID=A0ACB7H9F7_MANES|nr:hypothetical protein MANES_09G077815v8 [Manihot esculenta]
MEKNETVRFFHCCKRVDRVFVDHQLLAWNVNVNEIGQYHTLGDSVAATANIHTTGLGNS